MQPIALTRSSILFPITALLERIGATVEELFLRARLPVWVLDEPEALIPTANVARLLAHAARRERVDNLGLLAGQHASIDSLGVFGGLICSAPALGEALQVEIRHHPTFSSSGRMWLAVRGDQAQLCHAFTTGFDDGWQQAEHYLLMLMLGVLQLGAGPTWRPSQVQLQTGESSVLRDAECLSDATILFAQPATSITFPRSLLSAPLRRATTDPADPPSNIDAWSASAPVEDFLGSIFQLIETLSWDGYPHVQITAHVLGTSVRALQRQLAAAGVTHHALVGQARLATAATLLEETDSKILDIALDLGYSDHAHFTRAFRRWTGLSPLQFRRERRSGVLPSPAVVAA